MPTSAGRLASFTAELELSLGDVASVERSTGVLGHAEVRLTPARPDALVAGRVSEVFGPGRSRVTVTLADGTSQSELGLTAPAGCLPLPFWTRWGRRVHYTPYRADDHR